MTNSRREFLLKAVDVAQLKGLEIGALNNPLVKKEDLRAGGEIFYLDHLPTDELRDKYKDDKSVSIDEIVPVDFVCRDGDIIKATSGNTFDYVVASHVIEHAPNLLTFLGDIQNILKPGGACILIVPDKRFTFDLNRPTTTFGNVLEKFLLEANHPNVAEVYDHFAMATHVNGHSVWHGIMNNKDPQLLVSEGFAWKAANSVHCEERYYDVHVNVFTPQSFFSILEDAIKHEIVFFEVARFLDTQIGQIEFMIELKKPNGIWSEDDKAKHIALFPKIELENVLSPYMPQVKALSEALARETELLLSQQKEIKELSSSLQNERLARAKIEGQLRLAQSVLDRRSVKFVTRVLDILLGWVHKI